MKKKLSLFSLAMLIIAAIDSIRHLPSSALFGSSLIFFFVIGAILFLFPTALVSAQLTATYQDKGGIYHWVQLAFGDKLAMLSIWLQWINTMIWYPTILSFIAGTIAYLVDPSLATNTKYLAIMINLIFWTMTLLSLKGIHFSAKLNSICAILGTVIPMGLLIGLGAYWVMSNKPLMISFSWKEMIPSLGNLGNFTSLTAIMSSYLGMELAGVHVADVKNPQKNFPKVLIFSALFILTTMLLGSLSIAVTLKDSEINLIAGVPQVFEKYFNELHLNYLTLPIVLAIIFGSTGGIINWLTAPAKGLLHASEFGYLPKVFTKKNSADVPYMIMIMQGVIVSLCCSVVLFVNSVNTFYWFLTALSTNLYMLMYVLLFSSAIKLNGAKAFKDTFFKISKSPIGLNITSVLGLLGCFLTILVGFFPPQELAIQSNLKYGLSMLVGIIASSCISLFFIQHKKKTDAKKKL